MGLPFFINIVYNMFLALIISNYIGDKMSEKEKMLAGKIYDPTDEELVRLRTKAHRLSQQYNALFEDDCLRDTVIDELIPNKGKGLYLQGPIYFDYGVFTTCGEN